MNPPNILTICASLRAASFNAMVLATAEAELTRLGATVNRYAHLADLPHYNEDLDHEGILPASVAELRAQFSAADAVIIASPTYNHSIPGGLKDYIDWVSRPYGKSALVNKPVAIMGAGPSSGGGDVGAKYLEEIVALLGGRVIQPGAKIGKVNKVFSDTGVPDEVTRSHINATAQSIALAARGAELIVNTDGNRFELLLDGKVAGFADYVTTTTQGITIVELPHTETDPALRGQGIASVLVRGALNEISAAGEKVIPTCPFVSEFITKNDSYAHLLTI
jgi:NAD(P)H-dependent FMN reductase/predicted GNAT family acetyltransferase